MEVSQVLIQAWGLLPRFASADYVTDTLDLSIHGDSLTCVVGPDSSGKSRYLRTLAGIDPPLAGGLSLLDRNLADVDREDWRRLRREVGYLGADTVLLSNLDGVENVMLPALYHRLGGPGEVRAMAEAMLETIGGRGYTGVLPAYMRDIQRYRLAIARVLLLRPRVLFVDEPFRSLDSLAAANLNEFLLARMRAPGLAMLMATEDLAFAEQQQARILFVSRGRVAVFEDMEALYQSELPEVVRFLGMVRKV